MSEIRDLVLRATRIATDEAGNVCLNDLWSLAGKPENKRAKDWRRYEGTKALVQALVDRIVCLTHNSPEAAAAAAFFSTGRGKAAKTFAHPVLALAYAESLDPAIGVEVREVFLRYKANDVSLALEIMEGLAEQAEYDYLRVQLRQMVKDHNKLSAHAAQQIGVKNFEAYNGAGLKGLYNMTKAEVLKRKGLPEDANHLDYAGHEELAANYFKATQAHAKLTRDAANGVKGQAHANKTHNEIGAGVRATIKSFGGRMTEDEPALDHIKEAQKRLKGNEPKQLK